MALGTFTPPAGGAKASSFDPRFNANKPLIVVVREFREGFTTQRFPDPKDVVIVDLVDLLADTVVPSVIWGAAAIVDRLKDQAGNGEKLPVIINEKISGKGNKYTTIDPLQEGQMLDLAVAWDKKNPTRLADESEAHRAVQAEAQNAAPAATPAAAPAAAEPKIDDAALAAAIAALGT